LDHLDESRVNARQTLTPRDRYLQRRCSSRPNHFAATICSTTAFANSAPRFKFWYLVRSQIAA
ncbi:MAG: hypothetical protein MUF06_23740, partial [Pirellulaceae bacterium]|nr:hypothetical protein [Pirellulaceae bacterium]